jgi:putative oxidoreductase
VQRLFSTFPNGWPGAGLLLVRLCLATALIHSGTAAFQPRAPDTITIVENLIAIVAGIFLLVGLWTPLAGGLAALAAIAQALSPYSAIGQPAWIHAFLPVLCVAVAMLGPGAWSIDSRLFGRRRFNLDRTRIKSR